MNKIYKLVWSKVRSAWVVTSEIAKGHGKDSSSGRNRSMLKAGVVMALLGGFMTAGMINADAALTAEQKAVYEAVLAELKASGKVELGGTTEDTTGIAIGKDSSTSHHMGVAIGEGAKTDNQGNVAIGHKSYSYDSGVAIGTEARADGLNTVAIGDRVTAKNPYSVVISTGKPNTDHRHKYTEAVNSDHATVLGDDSVVGKDNKYGIAIGSAALSDKSESGMAIGRIATVINSEHGIALGRQSEVKNSNGGIVVGPLSKVLNSNKGLAMGDTAHIEDSEGGVAYGPSAYVTDSSDNGVAIGGSTKVKKSFQGIAIGYSASVENAGGAVAVGEYSQANAKTSVAIGSNSRADVAAGQIGYLGDSKTDDVAWKSSLGAVSVGTASSRWGAMTRQITNLAAGTKDTDAVNVAQLTVVNDKADANAKNITNLTTKVDGNTTDITNLKKVSGKVVKGINTTVTEGAEGDTKTYAVNVAADGQIANGNTGIVTGDTVYQYVNPIKNQVTNIASTVNNLKGGFTIKDANNGTANVTLGDTEKTAITFQAATEDTDGATSALTAKVDADKKVTYTLNTKKLKEEMGLTQGVGSMSSWKLKATGGTAETIADGEEVEFAVAEANKGLTVTQDGKKIQYGIDSDKLIDNINSNTTKKITNVDGDNIDLSKNTSIKTINENITKLQKGSGVHYFSVNDAASKVDNYGNDGATGTGSIAIGKKTKSSGDFSVAVGNEAAAVGHNTVALGWGAQTNGNYGVAIGQGTKVSAPEGVAIGSYADVVAYKGVAIGTRSYADREGGMLGYASGAKSNDLDAVLEAAGLKDKFEGLKATVAPLMPKYMEIGEKFNEASRNDDKVKQDAAMQEMNQFMADNPEFAKAIRQLNDMSNTWQASESAVSIGDSRYLNTRQIIGVAAGTKDTDAVNVAQLKALNTKVDNGAIHYYSVTSDKKAAGSNFDNDGAKAADSMVIGIGSTSEAPNSTVIGNNNTLKRHITDKNGSSSLNNIVVGQSLEVEGAHNAVFGTDYQNNRENRKTMVAGKYNTVIGVGNLAGYTAEKDPQDRSKWIYSKVENGSDSGNVVVGMNNTATRNSIVIGAESEASSHGTSVGSNNKVIGDGDYGLALGNDLTVNGEQAVAIGSGSKATVDYTMAIGQEAIAEKESSIALGNTAKAENKYSVAVGSFATATARSGVAIGSSSLADREKGAIGYLAEANTTSEAWKATRGAISIGNSDKKYTRQLTGLAAGTEDTDAVNVAQLKALNTKVDNGAIHYFSVKSDDSAKPDGTNWKNDGAKGTNSIAIGQKANAGKTNDIAIGTEAAATGGFGFAAGHQAKASGNADIAIGPNAEATGGWGVAIGQDTKAQASTAVAMAYGAEAKGANSLAIGVQSEARTNDSSAYGRGAKALGQVALAVGTLTKAEGNHSSVFGYKATTDSTAWNGTAIGRGAYIGKQAPDGTTPDIGVSDNYYTPVDDDTAVEAGKETKNSTAVGFGAKSFGYQNTALGAGAEAFDTNTVAVGVMSKAIGHYANALGKQARAEGTNSTAIGHFARALGESSMALGDYAITSTLDGTGKVNQSVALGSHARVAADNSLALGYNSLASIADDVDTEAYLSKEAFKKENGVVSVGNKAYTIGDETIAQNYRRITNVAGGADANDAVNVAQLKVVNAKADKNAEAITNLTNTVNANGKATIVKVDGEENKADGNLTIKKTEKDGQTTYDLSLSDNITIGKDGKDGKIGINGKDGKSADITVGKGEAGVDGKDGITRIIYTDKDKKIHEVATLDDGLKFKGDNDDVVIRKLNTQLNITGGADAADLSDDNIGVVGTAGDNGGMKVKLSKKLKGLTSAEFKDGDNVTNITAGDISITKKDGDTTKTVN
ncbi:ESPR-type extended signal peptide-containing protein, partial [Negativicoccus succinicivorans]